MDPIPYWQENKAKDRRRRAMVSKQMKGRKKYKWRGLTEEQERQLDLTLKELQNTPTKEFPSPSNSSRETTSTCSSVSNEEALVGALEGDSLSEISEGFKPNCSTAVEENASGLQTEQSNNLTIASPSSTDITKVVPQRDIEMPSARHPTESGVVCQASSEVSSVATFCTTSEKPQHQINLLLVKSCNQI